MPFELNATHDPRLRSWLASANADTTDFPLQNLPFGVFEIAGERRGGVALGDSIIDLTRLLSSGWLEGVATDAARTAAESSLANLLIAPPESVSALRAALSQLYSQANAAHADALQVTLLPQSAVKMVMPLRPTAFTDFCASADHIRRMGEMTHKAPMPCWATLPVAYNGRASSVAPSGTPVIRPHGQFAPPGGAMQYGPEPMMDFELEFGAWLGGPATALGEPVDVARGEQLLFGCCLVNDWSARGIQFYEMLLGPHLGKSFLTTISPWIVTMEALAPFRVAGRGRTGDEPAIPDYLTDAADRKRGGLNVELTVDLITANGAKATIVRSNVADLFWTLAQMLAHQGSGGAPLEPGDLVATGTVSGPAQEARACLVEMTELGATPLILPDGTRRVMLEDGDTVTFHARATADDYVPIGFGECSGTIMPARQTV
ncbi:MAG: fumarylacetoacetate hydrolase family protein [Gammaproteobacteria bacterium]|nr:fumarylacetoacetate hydrolase family protein [Gammaproteobacteria bacterium]